MTERRVEHSFDCDSETFWDSTFFDPVFNRALFVERLKFERWEEIERVDTPGGFRRIIEAVPRVGDLPGPIKALLQEGAGYREVGEFLRAQSKYRFTVITKSVPERLKIGGEVEVLSLGPGRCQRSYTTRVEAKIFGVGGMLEKRILDDLTKGYEKGAAFTMDWLRTRGA